MKKKLLAILSSVLLLCAMLPLSAVGVSAEATRGTTSNGIKYEIINDQVIVTGCEYYVMGKIKIPNSIAGYPVTTIGKYAFYGNTYITSVDLPESISIIEEYAFCYCGIRRIDIPSSVTIIKKEAFEQCGYLTAVNIKGTAIIEMFAFWNCINLQTLILGEGVITIKESAFASCHSLSEISLSSSVTNIAAGVFNDCRSLKKIYYSDTETNKKNITISTGNNRFLSATWHYNCINPKDNYSSAIQHSVMDTENGNGLAFRFELLANGVTMKNGNVVDLTNATIDYLGNECKLVGMGAVLTNHATIGATAFTLDDVNGNNVLDIPTVYLQEADEDSCAFAARIINIPDSQLERVIYARAYYIVEVDGEEIVVYGDVDAATCAEYM